MSEKEKLMDKALRWAAISLLILIAELSQEACAAADAAASDAAVMPVEQTNSD